MTAELKALLAALARLRATPSTNLGASLSDLPNADDLPSPWCTWTLIGLVRHRRRHFWVADMIRTRLHGDPADLAQRGAFGHPTQIPQAGPLPRLSEWEYYFHGRGCCIRHKVNGDAIDVDFWEPTGEYFSTWFYQNYLQSLRHPEPPEQRLLELHPSPRTLAIAIDELLRAGGLASFPDNDGYPYRVADDIHEHSADFDFFCDVWQDEGQRIWLAAAIGDWLAADELASDQPKLRAVTMPRAASCRDRRQRTLHAYLPNEQLRSNVVTALADLPATDLDRHLQDALLGPHKASVSAALDVVTQRDDPAWCPRVYKLFHYLSPSGRMPIPHLWMLALKFLLRHQFHVDEMHAALALARGREFGEAILLALEHQPRYVLPLVRTALREDVPADRTQVVAILALIDADWSRRELLQTLELCSDQKRTAAVRAALMCGDADAERAVLEWEERHPQEEETGSYIEVDGRMLGPFYSFDEISLRNTTARLQHEMQELHDRVLKVRRVVPPEPSP